MSSIPLEGYAFLDALAVGEDYNPKEYNELYGGGHFTSYAAFPQWEGKDDSHAAGRYQFEPATWAQQAKKLHLTDFSPASQDEAAWDLACTVYERFQGSLLTDLQGGKFGFVPTYLESTWTSLNSAFPDRYAAALAARKASAVVVLPTAPESFSGFAASIASLTVTLLDTANELQRIATQMKKSVGA